MFKKNLDLDIGWNLKQGYLDLPEMFFTKQKPTAVSAPKKVIINYNLAEKLGLQGQQIDNQESIEVFAGNLIPIGAIPLAQAYAGHQFGHFTILGDGRALLLGEQITPSGERFDIQLKGSGPTSYSRSGDGRATLGPMLREYIISEAMHALGIPTTRSLAVVTTGEKVLREQSLPGAVLTRIATSHLRVGTFQYAHVWGSFEDLQALADYTIARHFPQLDDGTKYQNLLREVITRQAQLIAKWQLVGFIHGVMNTDNMSLVGETIDYGPCAFMDIYDPTTVFSSIDRQGRYAYQNQPVIAQWNLARFTESLLPLLDKEQDQAVQRAESELAQFKIIYQQEYANLARAKLGLYHPEDGDRLLFQQLLDLMAQHQADFTNTFRDLTLGNLKQNGMYSSSGFLEWLNRWQKRLNRQGESKKLTNKLMKRNNPAIIPRNHRVEEALDAAVKFGDYSSLFKLNSVLKQPYEYSEEQEEYATLPSKTDCQYQTFCGT